MTNEIKEMNFSEMLFNRDERLLDYITNLQEEIKEWEYIQDIQNNRKYRKMYLEERRKEETNLFSPDYDEVYQRYYEQKDEIARLKDLCDKYEEEHSNEFQCWKRDRKELLDKRTRINKAVEYIENNELYYDKELGLVEMMGAKSNRIPVVKTYNLLNILRGDE